MFSYISKPNPQDVARVSIIAAVFAVVFILFHFDILKRFELVTYDYRCLLKGGRPADPRIVVIEISDDSIQKIGRWPWSRSWHATLIKILEKAGAKAVAFDVIFSEPSDPKEDAALSQSIEESRRVYLAQVVEQVGKKDHLLTSLPEFKDRAKGQGHINLRPDIDGTMRRMVLVKEVDGRTIPQLSLKLALDQYEAPFDQVKIEKNRMIIPIKNDRPMVVPFDKDGNFIINWAGRWHDTFIHYSFVDVIASYASLRKGETPIIPLESFRDKICYVGTSATGLFDIRPTPLEPAYPAVGVNLTILNNLLERKFIRTIGHYTHTFILVLLSGALFFILKSRSYFKSAILTVSLAAYYLIVAVALFIFFNVWINVVYPLALIFLTYFCVTLYTQVSVTVERTKLLKLATRDSLTGLYNIGHFKLLLRAELTTLAIRREKKMSIVMSDVDNFKKTNDTYGHVTGDSVLREVAEAFKANCRALDVAARYGGEEFILMLPGANAEIAYKISEKIRQQIAERVFPHEKGDFSTTISLGVTQMSGGDTDIELIVGRADKALYEAKHTGKNKAVIAKDSPKE